MNAHEGRHYYLCFNLFFRYKGRELRVRHYRDGKELPWLLSDTHYDFDYQQARLLPQEVKLLPGDHLTMGN